VSRADVLDELLEMLAEKVAEKLAARGGGARTVFTADALPPECTSRDSFLRRHRDRMRSRAPGWTRSGRVRAVTAAAWAADVAAETAHPRRPHLKLVPSPVESLDDQAARELGIRKKP
jgi:hypothetical protein